MTVEVCCWPWSKCEGKRWFQFWSRGGWKFLALPIGKSSLWLPKLQHFSYPLLLTSLEIFLVSTRLLWLTFVSVYPRSGGLRRGLWHSRLWGICWGGNLYYSSCYTIHSSENNLTLKEVAISQEWFGTCSKFKRQSSRVCTRRWKSRKASNKTMVGTIKDWFKWL